MAKNTKQTKKKPPSPRRSVGDKLRSLVIVGQLAVNSRRLAGVTKRQERLQLASDRSDRLRKLVEKHPELLKGMARPKRLDRADIAARSEWWNEAIVARARELGLHAELAALGEGPAAAKGK